MRHTHIRSSGTDADRYYVGTEEKFCCVCHFGDENRAIMDLLDLTWGYAIVEDRMQIGPKHRPPARFKGEIWVSVLRFSEKTPEELRRVLEGVADALRDGRKAERLR